MKKLIIFQTKNEIFINSYYSNIMSEHSENDNLIFVDGSEGIYKISIYKVLNVVIGTTIEKVYNDRELFIDFLRKNMSIGSLRYEKIGL
ncbi:MAG: hypothetical protein ACOC2W_03750 [bacterium]